MKVATRRDEGDRPTDYWERVPAEAISVGDRQQQGQQGPRGQGGSQPVELGALGVTGIETGVQDHDGYQQGDDPYRNAGKEDPAPAQGARQDASQPQAPLFLLCPRRSC